MTTGEDVMRRMALAKVFRDNEAAVNAMDFSSDGEFLVTSSDDETLHLYAVQSASMRRTIYSKKYGIDLVRFTHHNDSVLCASKNGWDDTLRYLSLHDNTYLRYFKGHRDRVVSLNMSPTADCFASGSLDGTVRMWDLRQAPSQGLLRITGRPAVAYDPSGVVLAVATSQGGVKLFDVRHYEHGPFATATLDQSSELLWSSAQFSDDGKYLLLATLDNNILLLDAFLPSGRPHRQYTSFQNESSLVMQPTFAPGSHFVLSGSEDGTVHVWSVDTGAEICVWRGHTAAVGVVRFNSKYLLVASACTNLALWQPSLGDAIPAATADI